MDVTETSPPWGPASMTNGLLPSDNSWGIPVLRRDLEAHGLDAPVVMWGTRARRGQRLGATVGFYVDDYRFATLWPKPWLLLAAQPRCLIEPNFTLAADMPPAVALYQIYRKRYLTRAWQDAGGVRVFVDLNVPPALAQLNLLGVPVGWRAYATRGYSGQLATLRDEHALAVAHAGSAEILFVVYGGGRGVREQTQALGGIWLAEQIEQARRGRQAQPELQALTSRVQTERD